jgi:hypothetical protein
MKNKNKWKYSERTPSGSYVYSKCGGSDNYENSGRILTVDENGFFILIDKSGIACRRPTGLVSFKKW